MESGADSGAGAEGEAGGEFLRCFGRQIKLLREQGGLTQAQLGERVGYGEAQIAAVEQGRRIPKPELIDAVGRVLGARGGARNGGDCVEVADAGTAVLVRDSKRPGEASLTVGAGEWAAFMRMAERG
ncbi:helix-turn-helix domain-containing protein [Streptomyces sp. NPDC056580]|uniref:helix-turn-helix domain-containing protein n=1 Tax=Streptomyces sp. NPDC056580 TaxID=3345872 RepID=UPI003689D4D5